MKKIKFVTKLIALFAVSSALLFTSCKKDEPEGPTLLINANVTEAWQGDTIVFTYTASSNVSLTKLTYSTSAANIVPAGEVVLTGNSAADKKLEIILPTTGVTEGSIVFTFKAIDKDGEEYAATKEVTITLKKKADPTVPFTATKNGYFYHVQGSLKGAWNLDADNEVGAAEAASLKSVKNTDAAAAIFTGSWTSDNGTTFVKANSYDYAAATVTSATTAFAAGTASATVTNPAANDIYIAKKGDVYYAIKITAVDADDNTCNCGNKGKITFEYKK